MAREYILERVRPELNIQIDYARELNEQQHAAVTAEAGPALVIAGAGSGKTRTLTYRVAFLLENGVPADRILLLTFTNKAAKEMMRRVSDLIGQDLRELWGGTFHSIGNRVLRRHADRIGFKSDFTILDREDSVDLVQAAFDETKWATDEVRLPKADVIGEMFSMAVNMGLTYAELIEREFPQFEGFAPALEDLHRRYIARKKDSNVMDFDDLLVLWLGMMKEHEDLRDLYQRRFQFVLVDEYQDTNSIQAELIDLLAAKHRNLMVVGDDAQSIYSWRGANFLNILKFGERYEGAKVYKIETNYRSTPEILSVANAAISANTQQYSKRLVSALSPGMKPVKAVFQEAGDQAAFVAQRALQLRDEDIPLNEMAVLYRSHFHAMELQLELTRRNIPFTITSGIRFFEQAHIKDVASFLKLRANPSDEVSFKRIVKLLPGVGGKGASKLWDAFNAAQKSRDLDSANPLATALQQCAKLVSKKTAVPWAQMVATFAQMESPALSNQPAELLRLVLEAMYEDYLEETFANARQRREEIESVANFAQQYNSLDEFLTQLALTSSAESDGAKPTRDDEAIKLSSIHQAKGLEFTAVFVIMLCEGMFPTHRSLDDNDALEEERRLFYVAITRAKKELYLTYPLLRLIRGGGADALQQPSRFLGEIPDDLIEEWNIKPSSAYFG